jgi:NAD(P)-dependent dehydrogenase (short-subunit alcohol dehydrogenase family)
MRLAQKIIIVTGSTTGIGKAIAKRCLEEGARVLIHGLEADLGAATVAELDPSGDRTVQHIGDLTAPGEPARTVETAVKHFGKLDAVVNNAALVGSGHLENTDEAAFDHFIAANVKAPLFLIRAAIDHLEKTRGCVLNIGSVNAPCGEPDLLPYSISKGALMTLTRNLGDTLHRERGVRVNQINPGWILTENERRRKQEHGLPEDWPRLLGSQFAPSGRIFDPAEIAAAVIYFLGDESGPVSGSVLDIEQYPMNGRNPAKTVGET